MNGALPARKSLLEWAGVLVSLGLLACEPQAGVDSSLPPTVSGVVNQEQPQPPTKMLPEAREAPPHQVELEPPPDLQRAGLNPSSAWARLQADRIDIVSGWSNVIVDGRIAGDAEGNPSLVAELKALRKGKEAAEIILLGSRDISERNLVALMQAAKAAGYDRYSFYVVDERGIIDLTKSRPTR